MKASNNDVYKLPIGLINRIKQLGIALVVFTMVVSRGDVMFKKEEVVYHV